MTDINVVMPAGWPPPAAGLSFMLADVFVSGNARTKGSMESKGRGKMVDKPATYTRMALVRERLEADLKIRQMMFAGVYPWSGRVGVRITSYMQAAGTGKQGWLERAKAWLISKLCGDVDKQARLVLDCLTEAGVVVDDGQVVHLEGYKRLAQPGMIPGQQIQVWTIGDEVPW